MAVVVIADPAVGIVEPFALEGAPGSPCGIVVVASIAMAMGSAGARKESDGDEEVEEGEEGEVESEVDGIE